MLTTIGHKAYIASCGQEALKLLENNEYDLMITDVGMPNMNGWQLAETIKGKYPNMKVAIVTGWGNDVSVKQKKEAGVAYVLGKPVTIEQIEDLVKKVLQKK